VLLTLDNLLIEHGLWKLSTLLADRLNQIAEPFGWKFTCDDLATWLQRLA
jgi:hypothetical protein